MGRTGLTDGVRDPVVRFVCAFCRSHGLEVLEFGETYRINGDMKMTRKQVISLIMAKSPNNLPIPKLDLGLTFYETTVPVADPFLALREQFCSPVGDNPQRAWALAREAGLFPFRYGETPEGVPGVVDENAANLLCWMAQIKRRLMNNENLGGLAGVLNSWGAPGSGKSEFLTRVLQPIRAQGLVEVLAASRKLLDGFHSGALAKKLVLFGDDLNPISSDMLAPFKAVTTLPFWKIDEKYLKPGEGRIRAGIAISANKSPEEQYRDPAFARRLFNIAWPVTLELADRPVFVERVLPAWQVEELWAVAPTEPPEAWRQLVERSRERLYGDGPIKLWFAENCWLDGDDNHTVALKHLFQQFRTSAEEGNWQVRHITDRIFKKELEELGAKFGKVSGVPTALNVGFLDGKAKPLRVVPKPIGEIPEVLK